MFVEMREYSLVPGSVQPFLDLYARCGWPVQSAILGKCLGWYVTEVGDLNGVVHLWAYIDAHDRETRRQRLGAHEKWNAFLASARPYLATMGNRLLRPVSFTHQNQKEADGKIITDPS